MKLFLFLVGLVLALVESRSVDSNERIIGGQNSKPGQFPHHGSLRFKGGHTCGCSLIKKNWVVTAAHCVRGREPKDLAVVFGTIFVDGTGGTDYNVSEVEIHPNYSPMLLSSDIALVKLSTSVTLDENIKLILIYRQNITDNSEVTLCGWGRTFYPNGGLSDILQWIPLRTISRKECNRLHLLPFVWETEICTLTKYGEGACHGDSGGGLIYKGKLCGIVSWGTPCAVGLPDVFTNPNSFFDWIQDTILDD